MEFKEKEQQYTSVIPARMIKWTKTTKPNKGEEVMVCCDGKEYVAIFHYSGKFYSMLMYITHREKHNCTVPQSMYNIQSCQRKKQVILNYLKTLINVCYCFINKCVPNCYFVIT